MTYVPPDGPVPCDLAIVGEAPNGVEVREGRGFVGPSGRVLWGREPGDLDLIGSLCGRPRGTCYVSNVCKEPVSEIEWRSLMWPERERWERELLEELGQVKPRLVLAFGRRASLTLVPEFGTMATDHGKPTLGYGGKYMTMALWHPAAYLRGNRDALGAITMDLLKVGALLTEGLVELLQPLEPVVAEEAWPESIGFLTFGGERKTGRCKMCGKTKEISLYSGEGLKWVLCKRHAKVYADWAITHLEDLYRNRNRALEDAAQVRLERLASKMQKELQDGRERWGTKSDALTAERAVEVKA